MKWIYFLDTSCQAQSVAELGGKGASLARLAKGGYTLPATACVVSEAYREFIQANSLGEKIFLELNRKKFSDMRWEEIWDASLRIRNFFLHGSLPDEITSQIHSLVQEKFFQKTLAVRSSAPDEDAGHTSFAGLHESYLNISGSRQVVEHIKKVWASLWSDRALLYRQELGLDVSSSTMAVVLQEMIVGESSGIVFSQHPEQESQMIIESVYGLNQGLVDGEVEPDRWIVAREDGAIVSYSPPSEKRQAVYSIRNRVKRLDVAEDKIEPPIDEKCLSAVRKLALGLERFFDGPQDIEWTLRQGTLFVLQSRPVTSLGHGEQKDERSWYLSLHRSFENLVMLRQEIEEIHLPAMDAEAVRLSAMHLGQLTDSELAAEIEKRIGVYDKWVKIYWSEFIPFAHGMRLFGEVYNDAMQPDDPFEFVALLSGSSMLSTTRNDLLAELAAMLEADLQLKKQVVKGELKGIENRIFLEKLHEVQEKFGSFFGAYKSPGEPQTKEKILLSMIYEYSKKPAAKHPTRKRQADETAFLAKAAGLSLPFSGSDILEIGRASYRLRDDDNIYLGRIEKHLAAAIDEGRKRIEKLELDLHDIDDPEAVVKLLRGEQPEPGARKKRKGNRHPSLLSRIKARQLIGQPASRGIARGRCRLVQSALDLAGFKQGEVLVVDAIDPNMTFVAPLAAAIVERRGGMLIHGAIIAREYGIPCVTGVPEAMQLIHNGDTITVDGYLGIVTLGENLLDEIPG